MPSLSDIKSKVEHNAALYETAVERHTYAADRLKKSKRKLKDTIKAQEICQLVTATIQHRVHEKIATVVSHCLETVFEEPYKFRILFERKRGKTDARLVFERGGLHVDPLTASGGGVVDVAAFALRLSCLLLTKPNLRKVLILDEPFRFVSEEYQDRVASMLRQISKDMKVQVVQVTHNERYKIGKVVRL